MTTRWHDQWIETLDGVAYVRGTSTTVDQVQAYWKRPGVGAATIRKEFPHLTEAQLGAAVTWVPESAAYTLTSILSGPPQREMRLTIGPESNVAATGSSGWELIVYEFGADGQQAIIGDHLEFTLGEIQMYFELYTADPIVWRDERGDIVELALL